MGNNDEAVEFHVTDSSAAATIIDGRYQLGPVLGRGAMSTVYRAADLLLGRDVAIKIFLPGSGDDSFRARQETEMRLLAGFDHPGLVAAFDAGVDTRNDEERAYLVMELAGGRDLKAVLSDGPLTHPETTRIGERLAGALAQVHAQGVIHRDIKPANILVSEGPDGTESVKLADFGVALVMEDNRLTATGFTVGTAQYLSPEQAQGLHLTPASDIYSLGLVLLECLTGKPEYPGTPVETASARLHRAPEIPEDLPNGLRGLLQAMTDMDPERRPTASEVEEVLAGRRRKLPPMATAILPSVPAAPSLAPVPAVPSRPPHVQVSSRGPAATAPGRRASATGSKTLGKRPKILAGLVAAALAVPVGLALVTNGVFSAETSAEPTRQVDPGVSVIESQPSGPAPVETAPPAVAPAVEVVDVPDQPAVPVPAVKAPEPAQDGANTEPQDVADAKSGGKSGARSEKGKGNGRG
ncbi:protein kinase [Paenarthrobacter sp. RAF54_2]|uniref:serine/threonine-protein kinase n=1 Tax=Paenarthrobacter sp. RAF54_2 TaxID=3233061 RepID=UPI003F9433CC